MDNKQYMLLINDHHIVENAKTRLREYVSLLREPTTTYLTNQNKIEKNKCGIPLTLTQPGVIIYQSKRETHWIVPTPKLITTTTPHQYAHKVLVLNLKTGLFDTVYPYLLSEDATDQKCIEYVLRWQEAKYQFSWRDNTKARTQLENIHKQMTELGLIVGDEFSEAIQKQVEEMHDQIREELGIVE